MARIHITIEKSLNDHGNDGVGTHLEPDILKCSGGNGIPVGLFQILKDDAMIVLHSICQQICKTQQWPQD